MNGRKIPGGGGKRMEDLILAPDAAEMFDKDQLVSLL